MEKHVLSDWFARLDEVWILARLDREKPDWITTSGTVSHTNRTDAAIRFMDTASTHTNRHARDAKGTGNLDA